MRRVLLVMVVSADGETTRHDKPGTSLWASEEDQVHFRNLKNISRVIVMGRKTYDHAKDHIAVDGKLRIVMSRAQNNPSQVIEELESGGYDEVLLVGGSEINGAFFRDNLITDLYLTIEPKLFGIGLPLARGLSHEVQLELLNVKQLNPQGTLLLHYHVKH